jgi:hypothetical protein
MCLRRRKKMRKMMGGGGNSSYISVSIAGIDAVRKYLIKFDVDDNINDSPQLC